MPENMLVENPTWTPGIYQIETDDPVVGGPDGISNRQARELANRTAYLKQELEAGTSALADHEAGNNHPLATTGAKGMVVLATVAEAIAGALNNKAVTPEGLHAAVQDAVTALVNSAPATIDTLGEIAAALGNDPNLATTLTNLIATKAALASPEFTGIPKVPTAAPGTNTTQAASTAFVATAVAAISMAGYARLDATQAFTKGQRSAPVAIDDAAPAIDLSASNVFHWTLGGNRTMPLPSNLNPGQSFAVWLLQPVAGGKTMAYHTIFDFPGGKIPVLSTAANARDLLLCETSQDGSGVAAVLLKGLA